MLKQREKGLYLSLATSVIGLVGLVLYIILDSSDLGRTFSPIVCVLIGLAVLAEVYVLLCGFSHAEFIVTLLYIVGLGFLLRATIGPLSDVWNGVNFIGGNAWMGVAFSGVFFLCSILSIISNYLGVGKKN